MTAHPVDVVLEAAASQVRYPDTPDIASAVMERIEMLDEGASVATVPARAPARGAALRRRHPIAVGLAVAALAIAVAATMLGARDAVADWLGMGAVDIEVVPLSDDLPGRLDLGRQVTLDEALGRAAADVSIPAALGDPELVLLDDRGQVTLVYGADDVLAAVDDTGVGALIGFLDDELGYSLRKQVDTGVSDLRFVDIDGVEGVWMEGGPHAVFRVDGDGVEIVDQGRLAANTLLWMRGDTTVRLEAALDLEEALEIATSMTD